MHKHIAFVGSPRSPYFNTTMISILTNEGIRDREDKKLNQNHTINGRASKPNTQLHFHKH